MARKRILFMHQVSVIGGASYCMLALLKAIDKKSFEPVALLRQEGALAEEIRRLGIEVCFLPGMPTVPYNQSILKARSIKSYFHLVTVQKQFEEILKAQRIDIVYLNNMMLYPYLKSAKNAGCKTIMHIREHWPKSEHQLQLRRAQNTH